MNEEETGEPNVGSIFSDIEKLRIWAQYLEEWNSDLCAENSRLQDQIVINWIIVFVLSILICVSFFV